jgi:hypothetical protein
MEGDELGAHRLTAKIVELVWWQDLGGKIAERPENEVCVSNVDLVLCL